MSLANLMTFPWIAERVAAGKLTLHGAWFAIQSGLLTTLRPGRVVFAPGGYGPGEAGYNPLRVSLLTRQRDLEPADSDSHSP